MTENMTKNRWSRTQKICGLPFVYIEGLEIVKINKELLKDKPLIEIYEKIKEILESVKNIDSKGYINSVEISELPIFKDLIVLFLKKKPNEKVSDVEILPTEYPRVCNWVFNVLLMNLYDLILYKLEENKGICDSILKADLEVLSSEIYSFIKASIRKKLQKQRINIYKEVTSGFDTEYKLKSLRKNELLSVQLAVNGLIKVKIPFHSEYFLSEINPSTQKEYLFHLPKFSKFKYDLCRSSIDSSIRSVRLIKYGDYDSKVENLKAKLKDLEISNYTKDSSITFSFPKTKTKSFIYFNTAGEGMSFLDLVKTSNSLIEPLLLSSYEKVFLLLKEIIYGLDILKGPLKVLENANENKNEPLEDIVECENLQSLQSIKKYNLKRLESFSIGEKRSKINYSVKRLNYFYAHLTNADLCMFNDFDSLKTAYQIKIVHKSFVTMRPLLMDNTNVFIRDTMLLSPAGQRSLSSIGSIHGLSKLKISNYEIRNMEKFLKEDKKRFTEYALRDALICLVHANYMRDFNFNLKSSNVPLTLSSLGSQYVKKNWSETGYEGYQVNEEYLLGHMSKSMTPKGLDSLNKLTAGLGNSLPLYIGNYKGGRNESFMYGKDSESVFYDYDLTSAYTTVMAFVGSPNYSAGKKVSADWLSAQDSRALLYSFVIVEVEFEFAEGVKYPSIPVYVDETTTVYPLRGKAVLTGAEYVLSKKVQCCKLEILNAYYVPFESIEEVNSLKQEGECSPFEIESKAVTLRNGDLAYSHTIVVKHPFLSTLRAVQVKRREYPKGTIQNMLYKEMGNSIYGNVVRGISHKMKYDTQLRGTLRMNGTDLSNPLIASWVTGFIRSIIGECLHNISLQKGSKVVSVTTDGFITDVENLESELIENPRITTNVKGLESEETLLGSVLLKEFRSMRKELSGEEAALELKTSGEGIISWTTRGQLGKNSKIKAATGLQLGNYVSNRDELWKLLSETMETESKSISYIARSLRGPKELFIKGGHVTATYSDVNFLMKYDNRRLIIEEDPKDSKAWKVSKDSKAWKSSSSSSSSTSSKERLLDSKPLYDVTSCLNLRSLSKMIKTKPYNMYTSKSGNKKYKSNKDLVLRNVVKILLNKKWMSRNGLTPWDYKKVKDLIEKYDVRLKPFSRVKPGIEKIAWLNYYYSNSNLMRYQVPENSESRKFLDYLKSKDDKKIYDFFIQMLY